MAEITREFGEHGVYGTQPYGVFRVWESATDIGNNTSTVSFTLTLKRPSNVISSATKNAYCIVDGQRYDWSGTIGGSGDLTLISNSKSVKHNSDGNKSISLYAYIYLDVRWSGVQVTSINTGDFTLTLTYLPQQANITGATDFNDEENPTITYNNYAGNSVTTLQACISLTGATDDISYRDISKTGNSYTFELTQEERNVLRNATPNSNTLNVIFFVRTIIGGNIYYSTLNKKMTIINANPTFSNFEFQDINSTTLALTGGTTSNVINVNGYSNIKVKISTTNKASPNKGASMSKYRFVIGNQTIDIPYSDENEVSNIIYNASNGIYTVYAIDSRGNSKSVTKNANTIIEYSKISLNSLTCNVKRGSNGIGTNAILTINGTLWNNNFGIVQNTIKNVLYEFKKTNSSIWLTGRTTITPIVSSNGNFTFVGEIASDNQDFSWDLQSNYDFRITVTDELSSTTLTLTPMASARPHISFADNGVGIMCDFDESLGGYLQINGEPIAYYPIGSIYMSVNNVNPSTYFGGTWVAWGSGRVPVGVDTNQTEFNTVEKTGGSKYLQSHTHDIYPYNDDFNSSPSGQPYGTTYDGSSYKYVNSVFKTESAGTGDSGNLQPYITVYMWKRTA